MWMQSAGLRWIPLASLTPEVVVQTLHMEDWIAMKVCCIVKYFVGMEASKMVLLVKFWWNESLSSSFMLKVSCSPKRGSYVKKKQKAFLRNPCAKVNMWTHFCQIALCTEPNFGVLFSCQWKKNEKRKKWASSIIKKNSHISHRKFKKREKKK